jgi:transcriptional regulator with AAA-type ATPase domain
VDARPGLLETASGGALFLDEIHNLPERVQRSLLRVIEDGELTRVGETTPRTVRLHFVLASNVPDEFAGLAHDLFARLRRVEIPSLRERKADIHSIFSAILKSELVGNGQTEDCIDPFLGGDHLESLLLDDFKNENIRGLTDLANRIVSAVKGGENPQDAVARIFTKRYADGPVAARQNQEEDGAVHYEQNKEMIISAYRACGENLSATERELKKRDLSCCRRVLAIYLKRWGVRD